MKSFSLRNIAALAALATLLVGRPAVAAVDPPPGLVDEHVMEWFIDADPGHGQGQHMVIDTSGGMPDKVSIMAATAALASGLHTLSVRWYHPDSPEYDANWSLTNVSLFLVSPNTPADTDRVITRVEYFLNGDPGEGNGQAVPVTPGASVQINQAQLSAGLRAGLNQFFVRAMDNRGIWTQLEQQLVFVDGDPAQPGDVATLRYRVLQGDDPLLTGQQALGGTGTATTTLPTTGSLVHGQTYKLGFEARDGKGRTSQEEWKSFTYTLDYDHWLATFFTPAQIADGMVTLPDADPDHDGLSNSGEFANGTNPLLWDTDGDLFADGFEVARGWNPLSAAETTVSANALDGLRNNVSAMSQHGLYTEDAIRNIHVGAPLLKINPATGQVTMDLQLQSSDDLRSWSNFGAPASWTDTAADKAFYRLWFQGNP